MKVLNLILKQVYFDQILKGEKTQEFRDVKPTTVKKLLQLDDEGYEVEDENGNAQPIKYDAIRFYVGYNKDRDTMLIEVKDAHCEIFTDAIRDEQGNAIQFKARDGKPIFYAIDEEGYFLLDDKGEYIEVGEDEDFRCAPMECANGDECVEIDKPIEYEHEGRLWVAEQVVYDLGKILECNAKKR